MNFLKRQGRQRYMKYKMCTYPLLSCKQNKMHTKHPQQRRSNFSKWVKLNLPVYLILRATFSWMCYIIYFMERRRQQHIFIQMIITKILLQGKSFHIHFSSCFFFSFVVLTCKICKMTRKFNAGMQTLRKKKKDWRIKDE